MKKNLTFILTFFVLVLSACESGKNSSDDKSAGDTTSLDKIAISGLKSLDTSKIPKYRFLEVQNAVSPTLATIDMTTPTGCTGLPTTIGDLNSGTEFNIYRFDQSMKASASAMGFSGSIGNKEILFIQDYVRYAEVDCGGVKKKYGIGLRCFIHVTSIKGDLSGGLSGIAASVELNRGKATFNLKALGFGIDGSTIANGLTTTGQYDVENFSKLAIIYNETLKTLTNNTTLKIKPVELP